MTTEELNLEGKDAQELFGLGVRFYMLNDHSQAAEALSRASELLVEEHKDNLHESLGKVYLFYGKALLGLVESTRDPLGEKMLKNIDDAEEDEDIEEANEPEDSAKAAEDSEEDGDDLELAWEVLEYAKKIFEKQGDKKQLAEVLIALSDVSLENQNVELAIDDIKKALELQKELLASDSRTVAETLYKLGMAYSIENKMDEAIEQFQGAEQYLKNRVKTLEESKIQSEEVLEEISEIRQLMPNIEEKIEEMQVYKNEHEKIRDILLQVTQNKGEAGTTTVGIEPAASGSSSGPKPSNISHLVKRKRKSNEMEDKN